MLAQQANVEVISNNIANMNTTGCKRSCAEFHDLSYQDLRRVGATSSDNGTIVPSGMRIGLRVRIAAIYKISEQGNLLITDNPLNLVINGKGHLQVESPSGDIDYTRVGALQLSPGGKIVTPAGFRVLPEIILPIDATCITVNPSGEAIGSLDGQAAPQKVGQSELAISPKNGAWRASATISP